MAEIILHQFQGVSVGLDKKDGYLNATKLCAAYSQSTGKVKLPKDWRKTKAAKEYISYVASVRNIVPTALVVVRQGGLNEQGTWIHPDLADDFAAWLSVEYKYAVSQWLQDWRSGKISQNFPESMVGEFDKSPEEKAISVVATAIDAIVGGLGMAPQLVAGIKCEAIAATYPEYRPALEATKRGLLLPIPSRLLNATELAALWSERTGEQLSARAMNKKLQAANLQDRTGDKALPWKAIGCGIDHSQVVADTARGHGKTVQSLRWHESILDLL